MMNTKKITFRSLLAALVIVSTMIGSISFAQEGDKDKRSLAKTNVWLPEEYQILNINNLWHWTRKDGWAKSAGGDYSTFFPRGKTYILYSVGFEYGAKCYVDAAHTQPAPLGQLIRANGSVYGNGYNAGWVNGFGATAVREPTDNPLVRIYRVRRDWKEMTKEELTRDAAESNEIMMDEVTDEQIHAIIDQYEESWNLWPVEHGAPFIDRNGNGVYDPPPADFTVKELIDNGYDEPGVAGADPNSPADQVVFTIYNDLDPSKTLFRADPIGLEIQYTLWGYKRSDPLGNIFFCKYRFINKGGVDIDGKGTLGTFSLDSMYVVQWCDVTDGDYTDDCVGCDTTLDMAFVWNGNPIDNDFRKFGLPPAAGGFDYLQGPMVPSPGDRAVFNLQYVDDHKNLGLTAFSYFSASSAYSDPFGAYDTNALRWYKMMRGYAPLGAANELIRYNFPPGVTPSNFPLAGDPGTGTGHIDGLGTDYSIQPGDRRMVLSSGPFQMAPGDTNEAVLAFVAGLGADRFSSIAVMKFNDRFAQNTYDALFQVASPPPAPDVKVAELDGEVLLEWGSNLERLADIEDKVSQPGNYKFEGYNVYQLPSANATLADAKRIVTYDLLTDPAVVLDEQFDIKSGSILPTAVQFGSNSGIQHTFKFNRDYIKDIEKIYNGVDYYVAVTAYSVSTIPGYLPKSLESNLKIIKVVPKIPFGTEYEHAAGDTLPSVHSSGHSDGAVYPIVYDPTALNGHDYQVTFTDTSWTLTDITDNRVVLANQTNQTGDDNFSFTDGFQLRVVGAPLSFKNMVVTAHGGGVQDPPLQGAQDWGGFPVEYTGRVNQANGTAWFFAAGGAADNSYDTFLSRVIRGSGWDYLIPNDFEYRFTGMGQGNYMYTVYSNKVLAEVPFEIWDVTRNVRLIPFCYDVDNNDQFNLLAEDHPGSGGTNDPYTDWIYPHLPADNSDGQGSAGYDAWVTASQTDIANAEDPAYVGPEIMGRNVWYSWNGGDVSDGTLNAVAVTEIEVGSVWKLITTKPNSVNDVFTFTAPKPKSNSDLQKLSADKVGVFPNPYYAENPLEKDRLGRFVTFNNLPPVAKIRIFTVSGHLIRILEKDNNSQFKQWDLLNQSGFPIASGVYIAHIEMPEIGVSKILKLVIVMEAEILDIF